MSFLTPLFLLGALAVAAPVVFHLVRRSSRENIPFSSLMFLKPTPPRMTRRNRLEHIFLLLLRCLAICILALGFARPFLQKPMAAAAPEPGGARMVVLVDTSASMQRDGVWPAALAKAETALKGASIRDQVALLTFDDRVESRISFDQWGAMAPAERASSAVQSLSGVTPAWRSTHLGNALLSAAEMLEDADKREQHFGPKRIVVITDLQEGSRLDGLQGYEWPRGVEVAVETVKARRPTNAGLHWVIDPEDAARTVGETAIRVRVSSSSDAQREQFQIRWEGVEAPSIDVYVPPGQSRIVRAPPLPDGATAERMALSGDDDAFDNLLYLVQPKAEEISVLFLGDDSESDPGQLLYYLKRAFQETRGRAVRVNTLSSRVALSAEPAGGAAKSILATNQLLILSATLPHGQLSAVRNFLNDGGTALLVLNEASDARMLGQLFEMAAPNSSEASPASYAMFSEINFEHPLFAPFSDPRFSDFTRIRFWKHRTLPADQLPDARVLVRFDNDDPAILEVPLGRGRLLVFTFSWRPVDSQLALSSKFVPLLYSVLEQAGGLRAQLAQVAVGEVATLPPHTGNGPLLVRKPDGSQLPLAEGITRFSQTEHPGVYEISTPGTALRFAVNLDPAESKTAPLPVDALERLDLPLKAREVDLSRQAAQQRHLHNAELENQQKLWRWLIVTALGVLLVETWLAGWLTRRSAARPEPA